MAFSSNNRNKIFTEINITPLTDIFLVLLIIMMVVAPTFQSTDNSISVPEINSGVSIEQKNATISVTKEGVFYINNKQINPDTLVAELTQLKPTLEKKEVVVKADSAVKSSEIMKIMRAAQEAEYTKLVVAGEPLSKKEQNDLNQNSAPSENTAKMEPTTQEAAPTQEVATPKVNIPQENWNE